MNWASFWEMCLILSTVIFAIMAVVVTIGGAADIARLLRRLRNEGKD